MDVTPFMTLEIAPKAVFGRLEALASAPRFQVQGADGRWSPVTWGEFAAQLRRVALFLGASGFESGARAAIFAPNSVAWMAAALGTQATGGVMVPIYGSSTSEQAAYVIDHSDARVVFVDTAALLERTLRAWPSLSKVTHIVLLSDEVDPKAVAEGIEAGGAPPWETIAPRIVGWSQAMAIGQAHHEAHPEDFERSMNAVSIDQPGVMLYTSGTSGQPKGVPLTHRNIAVNGRDWLICNGPRLDEAMVDLLWLPMSHVFGFGEACLGNTLGFTSYMCDPYSVLKLMPEVKPHVFMSVPAYWEKLATAAVEDSGAEAAAQHARLSELTGGRLKFCLSGGAGLKLEVKEFFHAAGLLIIEGYGLTEASPTLTLNRPDDFRFDSVGKALPSVELRLATDGEIQARGESIFGGYHKNPEATAEAFTADGWLKTGDLGRWTEDGFLQIIGRKKELLVTAGGKNISPANIEVRFADHPLVAHVVVYGDGKRYLVAGVWPSVEAKARHPEEASLRAALQAAVDEVNARLPRHETIKRFGVMTSALTVDSGLVTVTLKIKRKKVYEAFEAQFEALYA